MSGPIQNTTSTQIINGQYQIGSEKTPVSQLPANKAMEALSKTMQGNIGSTQKIAYRSLSEGTKGLPVYKAIWQGIKNISHNIEAFAKNMWNAEKRTQSALNIAKGALAIVKSLEDKGKAEELIQAFKNDPQSAMEMINALKEQKEAIFNQITEWHEKGEIPEEKVAVVGEGEHAGKVGTLKHSGDCGLLLQTALDNLSAVEELVAACAEEARRRILDDEQLYNTDPSLKKCFEIMDDAFNNLEKVANELPKSNTFNEQVNLENMKISLQRIQFALTENETSLKKNKNNYSVKNNMMRYKEIAQNVLRTLDETSKNINDNDMRERYKGVTQIFKELTENMKALYSESNK